MTISPEHHSSEHSTRLSAFFRDLDLNTHRVTSSHMADLEGFFGGLGPAVDIARRAQAELDRRAATRFTLFDFFRAWETDLSRIFGGLLDPGGTHGQGEMFLRLFLDEVRKVLDKGVVERFQDEDLRDSQVHLEHRTDAGRSIDIVLKMPGSTWIGIENKPWAGEQQNQVSDYLKYLRSRGGQENDTNAWLIYLSGDGKPPETLPGVPEESMRCPTLPYRGVQHGSPSLETWIGKCRLACEAERVRWFLTDLLEYIRRWFEPADTDPGGTGGRS